MKLSSFLFILKKYYFKRLLIKSILKSLSDINYFSSFHFSLMNKFLDKIEKNYLEISISC
jgi:hypothetical protein